MIDFDTRPEPAAAPDFDDHADSLASYHEAVRAIGEKVKAGAPVPQFFLSGRKAAE